jgi:uncharacterized protein with HEPN domain
VIDRERTLAKLDELDGYLGELRSVVPATLDDILVHEYGRVDDELIFETVGHRLGDFDAFRREILAFLRSG